MPVEKSAGAIIFRKTYNAIEYLLLQYPSGAKAKREYWDLPKGHIEKGESLEQTVHREVAEETGLKDIKIINGFKQTIKYFFRAEGKNIFKIVVFFLAETNTKNITLSAEHIGYKWLAFEDALKQITHKNAKEILKKANQFVSEKGL